jgi:CheY-like chemotaxis protein
MVAQGKPMRLRRAVIVDDEPAFVEVLTKMLSALSYDVAASTDSKASSTFDITDDDVVFLDVLMPDTSGLRVLEQLARQQAKCAVVLMSGSGERLDGAEKYAKSLGLNLVGVLEKPFRLNDIKGVLDGS